MGWFGPSGDCGCCDQGGCPYCNNLPSTFTFTRVTLGGCCDDLPVTIVYSLDQPDFNAQCQYIDYVALSIFDPPCDSGCLVVFSNAFETHYLVLFAYGLTITAIAGPRYRVSYGLEWKVYSRRTVDGSCIDVTSSYAISPIGPSGGISTVNIAIYECDGTFVSGTEGFQVPATVAFVFCQYSLAIT